MTLIIESQCYRNITDYFVRHEHHANTYYNHISTSSTTHQIMLQYSVQIGLPTQSDIRVSTLRVVNLNFQEHGGIGVGFPAGATDYKQ